MNWIIETGNMNVKVDLKGKEPHESWPEIIDAFNAARTKRSRIGIVLSARKENAKGDDLGRIYFRVTNKFIKDLNKRLDLAGKKGEKPNG